MPFATFRRITIALLIALAAACGLWGGGDNLRDVALVHDGIAVRAEYPLATTIGLILNIVGGAPATIGFTVGAFLIAARAKRVRQGLILMAILLSGRFLIEILKLLVRRARPALDVHPVSTHSLSFPSAHAANSMIVFGALALVFAAPRHRGAAVAVAILASLIVGCSRPLLGVHWPSDVIAGWALGAAWLLLWSPVLVRLRDRSAAAAL